jgi:hypothetical protein
MGNTAAKPEEPAGGAASSPAAATRAPATPLSPSALPPPVYTPAEALALIDAGAAVMEAAFAAAGYPLPGAPPSGPAAPVVWPPALTASPAASGDLRPLPVRGGWLPLPGGSADGGGGSGSGGASPLPTAREVGKWGRLMAERLVDALDALVGLGDPERAARRALLRRLDALHDAADGILAATAGAATPSADVAAADVTAAAAPAPGEPLPQKQHKKGGGKRRVR